MNILLNLYFRMWVLRANPQDLPVSRTLTYGLAGFYALVSVLSIISRVDLLNALGASIVDLVLLMVTVHALLIMAKVPERGYQTFSAIFGTSILLVILSMLLMGLSSLELRGSLLLLLVAWYLLIFGHILRQAISMPVLLGALVGLLYLMISAGLTSALFIPQPEAKG